MVLVVGMVSVKKKAILTVVFFLIQFLLISCIQSLDDNGIVNKIDEDYYENKAVVITTVADVFKETDLSSERLTQVIFNQEVTIIEDIGGWSKVKVMDGNIGWIRTKSMDKDCNSIMTELYTDRVVVTGKTKRILNKPGGGATVKEVVMGTELYILNIKENYYEVALPRGTTGWVERKDTIVIPVKQSITKTTGVDLAATTNKFINIPYLSGGISVWEGVDATGLVYICCRINGVEILRKDFLDYKNFRGKDISQQNIKPGDLIFLNDGKEIEKVFEVGIFIEENQFVYASKSKGVVVVESIQSEEFQNRLMGIKRIFDFDDISE